LSEHPAYDLRKLPMDLANLPAPVFTAVDGVTQGTAALVYVAIGVTSWLRGPGDIRTRVFLAFSMANLVVFGVPTFWWLRGLTDPTKLPPGATAAVMAALGEGTLLLFHFSQVFPKRRPWIRDSGPQMMIAYGLIPIAIVGLVRFLPDSLDKLTIPYAIAAVVFGFPLIVLLAFVLPVAGIVSLLRSYRDFRDGAYSYLKRPLEWILLSQIAGGTLVILFAPVLAVLAPSSVMQSVLTVVIWALGLMTPIAFAISVFRLKVLSLNPD
jgi:hypothetical protein